MRLLFLGVLLLPGCSNAPIAGTLDCLFPSRIKPSPTLPDLGRDDPATIRPDDRKPLPPVDPYPFDDPRRNRPADPLKRTTPDTDLPLLPAPGLSEPLLPPPVPRN